MWMRGFQKWIPGMDMLSKNVNSLKSSPYVDPSTSGAFLIYSIIEFSAIFQTPFSRKAGIV